MPSRIIGVGITGPRLTDLEKKILRETPPYSVVLFGRNVDSAEQLRDLVADIKSQSSRKPLIMIDQEGGRVDRLRNLLPGFPSAESFLEGDRTREMTEWFGRVIGLALRWFDIEINLAPVVDIHREPVTRGLERRCFGADAPTVIELAGGFIRGQASQGTASCLKHFPGLSLGSGDPHYGTTVIDLSLDEMKQADLQPYIALGNEAQAVMIGHAIYPKLEEKGRPASLSYNITTEILRKVVGFNGIAFSDDMEMHAVSDLGGVEEVTDRALFAGNDVILHCAHIEQIPKLMEHLERRSVTDPEFGIRFREATGRAEAYQGFIDVLRDTHPLEASSFEDVQDAVAEFVDAFESAGGHFTAARPLPPAAGADRRTYPRYREDGQKVDRREEERKKGTGPTGREEWT